MVDHGNPKNEVGGSMVSVGVHITPISLWIRILCIYTYS